MAGVCVREGDFPADAVEEPPEDVQPVADAWVFTDRFEDRHGSDGVGVKGESWIEVPEDSIGDDRADADRDHEVDATGVFGSPCGGPEDCESEACEVTADGKACSTYCMGDCPPGWECTSTATPEAVFLCAPLTVNLCRPCFADDDCTAEFGSEGSRCVPFGDVDGSFCLSRCDDQQDCPPGYTCEAIPAFRGGPATLCKPDTHTCSCSPHAIEVKAETACARTVPGVGVCAGQRVCTPQGLTDCNAAAPAVEALDGKDNDCDGLTDEAFDLDHDGVCDSSGCTVTAVDACPTVWNPDNDPGVCAPLGGGWTASRAVILSQDGAPSTWRRTHEPVEIPLANADFTDSKVPASQPDYDDVRVTETSPQQGEHLVPFELVGPRPHSDSPCPDGADPATFADRDDLCGVVGYWRLDGDAMDAAGQHDGSFHGTPGPVDGRFGDASGALAFDGVDDRIEIPHDASLGGFSKGSFTVEAWVFVDASASCSSVNSAFRKDHQSALKGVGLGLTGCRPYLSVYSSTASESPESALALSKGAWHHIAGVRDLATNKVTIYVDGVAAASKTVTLGDMSTADGSASIGATKIGGPMYFWHGRIDEVIIHSVAKSPAYIFRRARPGVPMVRFLAGTSAVANASDTFDFLTYTLRWGNATAPASQAILTGIDGNTKCGALLSHCLGYGAWWRFDEGSGTMVFDSSANRADATLSGGPTWVSGPSGTALQFDGVDAAVMATPAISSKAATVELYMDLQGKLPGSNVAAFETWSASAGIDIWITSGNLTLGLAPGGGTSLSLGAPSTSGFHVANTYDGKVQKGYAQWAKKGPDVANANYIALSPANKWWIGTGAMAPLWFAGVIDEVRVMTRALTADELLHLPRAAWSLGPVE